MQEKLIKQIKNKQKNPTLMFHSTSGKQPDLGRKSMLLGSKEPQQRPASL